MKREEGKWLVAVSGGADSMALLSMCLEAGTEIGCAHVNYHHRPQAEEEEAYIRAFCKAHGIPCHVENSPFIWNGNFEAAARERRYAFFAKIVKEYGYQGVLVAHHMDDQIETFLMQEEKGLIPDWYGLKQERMIHGVLVRRPLLGWTKAQLEDYCRRNEVRTFHDETNDDLALTRNRIRHEILPAMTEFERTMVLREIEQKNAVLQEQRCRVRTEIREPGVELARYRSLPEEDRLTLLYELLSDKAKRSREGLREVDHVLMTRKDFLIPVGEYVLAQKDGWFRAVRPAEPYQVTVDNLESLKTVQNPWFRVEEGRSGVYGVTVTEADFPLVIRTVRNGDRISMRYGTKPVHRFFIDRHISLYERTFWPVVENAAGTLILVPGLGCAADHYSIRPTFSVVQLSSNW